MELKRLARKFMKATGLEKELGKEGKDAAFIREVRKRFATADDAEKEQIRLEKDDIAFCDPNKQWPDEIKSEREADGRPCLVEDHLGPFIHQVCNEQRQNRPSVQVNPVDDDADVDTAEVLQGLVRHIEYDSSADQAYDTAFESMVRCGRGFYRLATEYADENSFEQDIKIKRIPNHFLVKMDPSAVELDFSDAEWGGIKEYMTREAYEAAYPDSELAAYGSADWESISDEVPDWMSKDGEVCMVAEYFYKEYKRVKIARLSDGTVKDLTDLPEGTKEGSELEDGLIVDSIRETSRPTVKWAKLNAIEVLERGEWAGKWIPIIPVLGTELQINGQRTWSGLIRSAKDPQRRVNYFITAQTEIIALAPRTPYIGPRGFMGNRTSQWGSANRKSYSALEYEAYDDQDRPLAPPQRTDYNPPIAAVTQALMGAEQGLKFTTGMFDASLGQREASQSGVAIRSLQQQGATGNFHYQDGLSRAIKFEGRQILDLIPKIIDTARTVRIIGEDQTATTQQVNTPVKYKGGMKTFDLTTGKYDVTVSAGPSYQTKRVEAVASMTAMVQAYPALMEVVGDLLVRNMDWPGAREIADRLKKMLPPQLQEAPEGEDGKTIPPQVQQALQMAQQKDQQAGMMIEQMTAKINELMDTIEDNQAKADAEMQKAILDNQTKKEIAQMNCEKDLLIAETQVLGAGAVPELKAKIAELEQNHGELAELALHSHEALTTPAVPEVEEDEETEEPKVDPMQGILQQLEKTLRRLGGPKKLVMDATGRPIGVAPDDGDDE